MPPNSVTPRSYRLATFKGRKYRDLLYTPLCLRFTRAAQEQHPTGPAHSHKTVKNSPKKMKVGAGDRTRVVLDLTPLPRNLKHWIEMFIFWKIQKLLTFSENVRESNNCSDLKKNGRTFQKMLLFLKNCSEFQKQFASPYCFRVSKILGIFKCSLHIQIIFSLRFEKILNWEHFINFCNILKNTNILWKRVHIFANTNIFWKKTKSI